jgi:hypothetical protein
MNFIVAIASVVVAAMQPMQAPYDHGRWVVVEHTGSTANIELVWPDGSNWKNVVDISDFEGLTRSDLSHSSHSHAFQILEDAGRFDFQGIVGNGRGSGEFHFMPNHDFGAKLASLGIRDVGNLSDWDLTNLAWGRFSIRAAHEFAALGFNSLSRNDMMELAVQHVTPHFVRSLQSLGVKDLSTVESVVSARMFGVTPDLVRALALAGISGLSGEELVSLRMSGVTPDFVRAAHRTGLGELSSEKLVEMRRRSRRAAQ